MAVNQKSLTKVPGAGILALLGGVPSYQHGSFFSFYFL